MKIVRNIALLMLLSFLLTGFSLSLPAPNVGPVVGAGGGGGGGACVALMAAPATMKVSYPASFERTWNAYHEVLKELDYKIVDSKKSPERKLYTVLFSPRAEKVQDGMIAAEIPSNEILGVEISIHGSTQIAAKEPTSTTRVQMVFPFAFSSIAKKRRALIHQKVLERLKAKPDY